MMADAFKIVMSGNVLYGVGGVGLGWAGLWVNGQTK